MKHFLSMLRHVGPFGVGPRDHRVFVGAFGKHPVWPDHMDDVGLETEGLTLVRDRLYVQGIGANVDRGAWDALPTEGRLSGFDHEFVWAAADGVVAGRLWASRDAVGRSVYPLVVCAQCVGCATPWTLRCVTPRLDRLGPPLQQATSAEDVHAALAEARTELRVLAAEAAPDARHGEAAPADVARLLDSPGLGVGSVGMQRVVYQMIRDMGGYRRRPVELPDGIAHLQAAGVGGTAPAPRQMRVPVGAGSVDVGMRRWLGFLLSELDRAPSVVLVHARGRAWIDAIVGVPGAREWFCLLADLSTVPLATDIPYTLSDEFCDWADRRLERKCIGQDRPAGLAPWA